MFGFEIPAGTPSKYQAPEPFIYLRICFQFIRLTLIALLFLVYFNHYELLLGQKDEESTPLLEPPDSPATKALIKALTYGVMTGPETDQNESDDAFGESKSDSGEQTHHPKLHCFGDWLRSVQGFSVFITLLRPINQLRAQLSILGVVVCLIVGRALNLLLFLEFGTLVESFSQASIDLAMFPGLQLGLFLLYRFLTSYEVMIEIESMLWLPFGNLAVRNIKSAAHRKVMALSRDFQTSKGAEEMTKIFDHATTVTELLRNFILFFLPCLLDILIFGIYLSSVFGTYMSLLLSITLVLYVWVSKSFATKRLASQRKVLKLSKKEDQVL